MFNKLESVPDSIGNLEKREFLNFRDNKLRVLPRSINNLTSLKELHVSRKLYRNSYELIKNLEQKGIKTY